MHFKLSDVGPLSLNIDFPETLDNILEMCAGQLEKPVGSVIVVRAGQVVPNKAQIEPNDVLDVYPAISGG
ncbi:MoaD/ThiS family protein [Desulfosediminicola flagellatus]|uniref:MoaD/ThiS family protein n=1 Tax=Desulfosediminicola flagellatus TaxID=2569541 RepID=UPI0010AC55BC|nr:MoaD/ThiS family protein [Desulfosediminicola flagellatus]